MERGQRVGARVAVVVVGADRDHGQPRPQHAQLLREAWIGGTVMGDLQHLDVPSGSARVNSDSESPVRRRAIEP